MRLDIRNMDRKTCRAYDVFLDGVKQTTCVVADEAKGFVIRYRTTQFGAVMVKGNKSLTERVEGVVTITLKTPVVIDESTTMKISATSVTEGLGNV